MADFYSIPLEEMNAFLRSRRFQPVDLTYRNRPVLEWVYERPLPRQPNHVVRVYTGINRYGRSQNQSRGAGKDAIRVQVIYKNGDVETLVTQPKRVHRVTGWADNLDNRLTEIAQSLPQVVFDRRGEPMTLRRKNGKYFWGSRDYPKYKETKPFRAEEFNSEQGAPLLGQTTEAPYEIKVYVPSTTLDQPISDRDFKSRIEETQEKLSELFGGFTTVDASGGYLSQQDGVISEPIIVVSSWATVEDYQSRLDDLERFLKQKKDDWGQEVIGFEFENDFFMYPEFRAEEIRCCQECDKTTGLTTIQTGTYCYDCLPINLGAEDRSDYRNYLNDLRSYPELKNLSDEQLLARGIDCLASQTANRETFAAETYHSEDEIPIIDLNSKKEIEEYGLFRPYEPNPPRREEVLRVSLTDAPENNNLFRINCDGVYAVRTIYGPSKIIFGRNMLASNKVSFNRSEQRHLSGVWGLMGLPRNNSGVVSAFGPLKNIEKMPQFSERPAVYLVNRKGLTPNRMVINMKGLVFAYDIVNREVEFYGGVPQSSIVSEDIPSEWVNTQEISKPLFAAEDNYDATYGKAQATIRRRLKNKIKKQAIMGTKAGQWSARKSQELKRQYEAACDKKGLSPYKGKKTKSQDNLSKWSKQKWGTASGKKSSTTGEPYFPAKAVAALKDKGLYSKAKQQKKAATKAGKQNARYSDDIRAVVKNYRSEEIEDDDFSKGDILISDLIPNEEDRMLYIPYPTKNDWRERYVDEGQIRVYLARHCKARPKDYTYMGPNENNIDIQWREITADRLNLLIDDEVAKLYIADYENTDDLYGKLLVSSEPIWKHLNYNDMLAEFHDYMFGRKSDGVYPSDIFGQLRGEMGSKAFAHYTLKDLEHGPDKWDDGTETIRDTELLDGIFADQLPDEKSFLSETYEEATGVEFSEQNPEKIEADAPPDWRESIITIPQSDSFGYALYRKMSDLTYNQVWRVLEIIDDLNRMSHHHALTKFSSNYVEIWIYSHDSGLVTPKDYHWAEDFNDMIATVDWQMWESETEWDDVDWENEKPVKPKNDWGDDIEWDAEDDWGSLRPETRPEFPTVDAKIASMLRNHSKVNVNGEQGCPRCGHEDLFYRESTGTGTKWYCYGCFYTEKTESMKSQKVITLEKYGLKVRCPDCNEMIVAYNQASVNSHRRKCGVTK